MPLILGVDADTKKATSKIKSASKKAAADVKQLEQKSVASASKIKSAFTALGPVLGALGFAVVLRGLKNIVTETITFRDEIAKFSKATGIGVEFLSAMGFAAERSGASIESMNKGFGRLARNISDAENGLATPLRAFEALGINITKANGSLKSLQEIFPEIADGFKNMTDSTKKAALAQELFGRAGLELVPLLNLGADGVAELTREAERLGIVFGEQAAVEAEAAADAMLDFGTATTALTQNLAAGIIPKLTRLATGFTDVVVAAQDPESSFGKFIQFLQDEGAAFAKLNPFVGAYLDFINAVPEAISKGNEATEEFLETISDAKFTPPDAPPVPFVTVPVEEMEDLVPPMEEVIAGLGEAETITEKWLKLQESLALEIPKLPDVLSLVDQRIESISFGVENITKQLILGVIHGRSLAKIMQSILANFVASGLASFLGQLAGQLLASFVGRPSLPGLPPVGSIAKVVTTQSAASDGGLSPVRSISTTNNNGITINLNVTANSFDRLFVETDLAPMLVKKVRQGRIDLTATSLR